MMMLYKKNRPSPAAAVMQGGVTLLELVLVLMLVAVLYFAASFSYAVVVQRIQQNAVQQQMSRIAEYLTVYKMQYYSYFGFDLRRYIQHAAVDELSFPVGAAPYYRLRIVELTPRSAYSLQDARAIGAGWLIVAIPLRAQLPLLWRNSLGLQCQQPWDLENSDLQAVDFQHCMQDVAAKRAES